MLILSEPEDGPFIFIVDSGEIALLRAPAAKSALSGESKYAVIFILSFLLFQQLVKVF